MPLSSIPKMSQYDWGKLKAITIAESNEPLATIPNNDNLKQLPIYFSNNVPYAMDTCVARQSVIQKLQQAADLLPANLGIIVLDAWRSRAVQQGVRDEIGNTIKVEYPDLSPVEQEEVLSKFAAPVSSDFISPHLTGGSVDITLFEIETGDWLDMGGNFDEPTERSYTSFYEDHPEHIACSNRRLLYSVMTQVGFTNLPTEWWHFDYGNTLWAHYKEQDHAIYGAAHWQTVKN